MLWSHPVPALSIKSIKNCIKTRWFAGLLVGCCLFFMCVIFMRSEIPANFDLTLRITKKTTKKKLKLINYRNQRQKKSVDFNLVLYFMGIAI